MVMRMNPGRGRHEKPRRGPAAPTEQTRETQTQEQQTQETQQTQEHSWGEDEVKRPPRTGHGHGGAPAEKSMDFFGSGRRLLGRLAPMRGAVIGAVLLTVGGVILAVIGPKVLGRATDLVFAGVIGAQLPAGQTKEQAIAGLRAAGESIASACKRLGLYRERHVSNIAKCLREQRYVPGGERMTAPVKGEHMAGY